MRGFRVAVAMSLLLEVAEWCIIIGFGALVGAIAGVIVINNIAMPTEDANTILLALFTCAGIFAIGGVFAFASGE
jgi:hypothetical protein